MFVLLCGALGCISAAIASPGTSFGVLQGAWRARWKVVRVSLLFLGTSLDALRGHVWGLLYPLWVALAQNIDIYGTWGLTLTPFWRAEATIHAYLRWISAWAKTCTIKEREARQ